MTNNEKINAMSVEEKAEIIKLLKKARKLYSNAVYTEHTIFKRLYDMGFEDILEKPFDEIQKPNWVNGDNISEAISCFIAYDEGDVKSLISLINSEVEE